MISGKCGIYAYFGYELSMKDRLHLIADCGFDSVGLWGIPDTTDNTAASIRLAYSLGLLPEYIHAPYWETENILCADERGKKSARVLTDNIHLAADEGVGIIVTHINSVTEPKGEPCYDHILKVCQEAEKAGVILAAENVDKEKPIRNLLDTVGSLKFCFDSGHELCYGHRAFLPEYSSRLVCVHLTDNKGIKDEHLLPGEGVYNWDNLRNHLEKSDCFKGSLMLESNCYNAEKLFKPEEYLQLARKSIFEKLIY